MTTLTEERTLSQLRTDHKALTTMLKSRGWGIMEEVMAREILAAARALAHNANMPDTEMHFRRGSIYTAEQLQKLPETLLTQFETAIRFREAAEAPKDDPNVRRA